MPSVNRDRPSSLSCISPQWSTRIAGGSQDNGTHVFSGTPFWDAFSGGDGGYTAINYHDPSIQWGETQWSVSSGTVMSGWIPPA